MAVELFATTQDTSPPNAFPLSDRLDSVRLRSLYCLVPLCFHLLLALRLFLSLHTSIISVFQSTKITITSNKEISVSDRRFRMIEI